MSNIQALRDHLNAIECGPVKESSELVSLVAACWDELEGCHDEGMSADKLFDRMENCEWHPPELTFQIERHGATVLGSSGAEVHRWCLNLNKAEARCDPCGYRQVSPRQQPMNVKPLADEVAKLILEGKKDRRLKWSQDGTVQVLIGKILPEHSAPKQTMAGRRKRFRHAVEAKLNDANWEKIRANVYRPSSQ